MHQRSKSPRKVPDRTLTRSDIQRMVQAIRIKKSREPSNNQEGEPPKAVVSNEDLHNKESLTGLNVCIFPCNNPIEHVIAECFSHAKHGRKNSSDGSQCSAKEDQNLSICEDLLGQVSRKIEELQSEMKLYQTQNNNLKNLQQQYHQMLSNLQKEKQEFESYRQEETQKLKDEIEEGKRKIRLQKRQKENHLKLVPKAESKATMPNSKEKTAELEKSNQLQRKLKLMTSENGRLKAKLDLAEQEKNSLRAMVRELEEQRLALMDKLEKCSSLQSYPSADKPSNTLQASPASPNLVLPSPGMQAEGGLQLALESAHGDSLCLEAKYEKEDCFLRSETPVHDRVLRTNRNASESSMVTSATLVARLSLENVLASRGIGEALSPVPLNQETVRPALDRQCLATLNQENLSNRDYPRTLSSNCMTEFVAAKSCGAGESRLSVAQSEIHSAPVNLDCKKDESMKGVLNYIQGTHQNTKRCTGLESGESDCAIFVSRSEPPCYCNVLKSTGVQVSSSTDCATTVVKAGIITKEFLSSVPFRNTTNKLTGLSSCSQQLVSCENISFRNIAVVSRSSSTTASLLQGYHADHATTMASATIAVSNADLDSKQQNPNNVQVINLALGDRGVPKEKSIELQEKKYATREAESLGMKTDVKCKGKQSQCKSDYSRDSTNPQVEPNHQPETNQSGPKEARYSEDSEKSDYQQELGHCESRKQSEDTSENLREILHRPGVNDGQPTLLQEQVSRSSPITAGYKRPPNFEKVSLEGKVGSLIKKYSQVCTVSRESTNTPARLTVARKSQSVQIQSSSMVKEKNTGKPSNSTWALDSLGQRMFLTVISKEIDPFTQVIVYKFQNGDKKDLYPDGKVVYHYAKSKTVHTVYPCGKKEIKFANGQVEEHRRDGNVEVKYPDGTVRRIFSTGEEEQETPDGTIARRLRDGTETVDYPNGQREVRSELYRSRYYPNGTVKTVYANGKQVTRYSTGRVKVKEADGTVLVNTEC